MTSATLSELYRADIQVVKVGSRYVVSAKRSLGSRERTRA